MEISEKVKICSTKPDDSFINEISLKLILTEFESELIDDCLKDLLSEFNCRIGTNEIEFYIQLETDIEIQTNRMKDRFEKELNNMVEKAASIIRNQIENLEIDN